MLPFPSHNWSILRRKKQTRLEITTRAGIKKEMAQPRMARSARIAELNLRTARIHEPPSTSMPGKVDKIIRSPSPNKPEKAQIAVDIPEKQRHRDLRIENALVDEHGDDVKLKKGAQVEVTVTSKDPNRRK
jgi:hypothetical protein